MNWLERVPSWIFSAAFGVFVLLVAYLAVTGKEFHYKDRFRFTSPEPIGLQSINPDYDSGWLKMEAGGGATINHGLGNIPKIFTVYYTTDQDSGVIHLANHIWTHGEGPGRGVMITDITTSSLKLRAGSQSLFDTFPAGMDKDRVYEKDGFIKVLLWK